jgi:hypothetical protein
MITTSKRKMCRSSAKILRTAKGFLVADIFGPIEGTGQFPALLRLAHLQTL